MTRIKVRSSTSDELNDFFAKMSQKPLDKKYIVEKWQDKENVKVFHADYIEPEKQKNGIIPEDFFSGYELDVTGPEEVKQGMRIRFKNDTYIDYNNLYGKLSKEKNNTFEINKVQNEDNIKILHTKLKLIQQESPKDFMPYPFEDYNLLLNRPKINGIELIGDKSMEEFGAYAYDDTEVRELIANKVDKVEDKGLSTNDYTNEEKTKLSGIATGAEVNVQADWSEADNTSDAYIQNKPAIPIVPTNVSAFTNDANYVNNTDYANGSTGGVFKTASNFATTVTSGGYLVSGAKTYNEYQNANVNMFVSKGTLDNVIIGKSLVSDSNYVHTDNNFDDNYMNKVDYIDDTGDGDYFLSNDGSYYPISADIRIPEIKIKCITKGNEKYLRLVFGAYSKAFENYVANNGISIHLLRYKNCCRREWNEVIKTKEKKWIHPSNTPIFDEPDKQCWGFACYQPLMTQNEYFDQIENADYHIANNGMVQSEYGLTYNAFKKGYLDINVRDLMSCIVKRGGPVTLEDTDMKIPTDGDGEPIKIMGTRTSPRRKRVRQPIKFVFALPIRTIAGKTKYQYGTSNEAILELMTLRDSQAMLSYSAGDKLLDDIGFGVLIK